MRYWGYPRYVSVEEKRIKAAKKLKQLQKKNPKIKPVVIEGRSIVKTWWGKSWAQNLERYADYENRIGRGRSYVRHGAVLDLQIEGGMAKSLVQGSATTPYEVSVSIQKIPDDAWRNIKKTCEGKIESLQELISGRFPKSLSAVFTEQGKGLFPTPKEIKFSCSCPDWADMCKHVAATLYGIGARLDENPSLFFKLRCANVDDLITQAMQDTTTALLAKAGRKTEKAIDDSNLAEIFGIDMDTVIDFKGTDQKQPPPPIPNRGGNGDENEKEVDLPKSRKQTASPLTKSEGTEMIDFKIIKAGLLAFSDNLNRIAHAINILSEALTIKPPETPLKKGGKDSKEPTNKIHKPSPKPTMKSLVYEIIARTKEGVKKSDLIAQTELKEKQISNIVMALKREGKIKNKPKSRGVYLKA